MNTEIKHSKEHTGAHIPEYEFSVLLGYERIEIILYVIPYTYVRLSILDSVIGFSFLNDRYS
jgi:hypothetical protein